MRKRVAWIVVAALTFSGVALAQGKPAPKPVAATAKDDPKQKYAGAVKKFNDKDYAGARTDFEQLDALKSTPQSQRYIALCLDKLGRPTEAVVWYEKFIANSPPGKMQTEVDDAKKRLEELKKPATPKLHIETTPAGAVILIDGKSVGLSPKDLELPSGKHRVHLELPGYEPVDKDIDASEKDVRAQLEKKVEPIDVPPPTPGTPVDTTTPATTTTTTMDTPSVKPPTFIPAIVTGGLATVAFAAGVGFGVAALGNKSDFDTTPTLASADAGRSNAVACEVMFSAALTLAVASAILFFSKPSEAKQARFIPLVRF